MHLARRSAPTHSSSLPIVASTTTPESDSPAMLMSRWELFRRDARKLENEIELKLDGYSTFCTTYSQVNLLKPPRQDDSPSHDQTANTLSAELEHLLFQLGDGINGVAPIVAEHDANPQNAPALTPLLYHHRNKLQQFTTEFRKTFNTIKQTREHVELLSSVRQDINAARKANAGNSEAAYLRERSSLLSSSAISDNIIEQAFAARQAIGQQQEDLKRVFGKLSGFVQAVPGLNGLMRAIVRRRMRDRVLIAVIAAVMMIFILWYWLSSA